MSKDYYPNDLSQPISAITFTPPGREYPKFDMISKGATQARNMLEDLCIQMAMDACAPMLDPIIIVEAALQVFQEYHEESIINILYQCCQDRNLDPFQWVHCWALVPISRQEPHQEEGLDGCG